ncbi:MAG: nitroreductase [Chloroflexi bacterium HGW-Chloroflexi-10]|nr:MAG: nitroreductase [Chloroflexi bacterium HGW-Chloroflexi-10]
MDVYAAINARQTIRDFSEQAIEPTLIERIISAGMAAPTNNHLREWHFVLLQDAAKRQELLAQVIHPLNKQDSIRVVDSWGMTDEVQREMYVDAIPKQYRMLATSACLMLPCFRQESDLLRPETLSSLNGLASMWCCIENMLVAAAAEGVFGVLRIPGENERSVIKRFLGIPGSYEIPCYLALGYPAEQARRARQTEIDLNERIHYDRWRTEE